jgi:2-isopropylmalate synthase
VQQHGETSRLEGVGNGPLDAAVQALGIPIDIVAFEERSVGHGAKSKAMAIVEASVPNVPGSKFGVGFHDNITTASLMALVSAWRRVAAQAPSMLSAEVK